jgi:hypothetical protein
LTIQNCLLSAAKFSAPFQRKLVKQYMENPFLTIPGRCLKKGQGYEKGRRASDAAGSLSQAWVEIYCRANFFRFLSLSGLR